MLSSMPHYRPTTAAAQRIACDGSCKSCGSHGGERTAEGGRARKSHTRRALFVIHQQY